ncbi:MAG: hypothetical protein IPK82_00125 [Polyangiaceae bacterium]|nr:hypothetical protein [Polyangiaceae bacterium]
MRHRISSEARYLCTRTAATRAGVFALLHECPEKKRSATNVPIKTYPWPAAPTWVHTNFSDEMSAYQSKVIFK